MAEAWKDNVSCVSGLHVPGLDLVVWGLFRASDDAVLGWERVAVELVRLITAFPPQIRNSSTCPDAHLSDGPAWVWSGGCSLLLCRFCFLLDDKRLQTGTVQVGQSPGLSRSVCVKVLSEHGHQVNQTA